MFAVRECLCETLIYTLYIIIQVVCVMELHFLGLDYAEDFIYAYIYIVKIKNIHGLDEGDAQYRNLMWRNILC